MGGISQDVKRVKMWVFTLYSFGFLDHLHYKISLLCRLQVQTLPDATPPIGKIGKTVTFEPVINFIIGRAIFNRLGVAAL